MTRLRRFDLPDLELLTGIMRRGTDPEDVMQEWKEEMRKRRAKRQAEDKIEPNPREEKIAKEEDQK